LIFRAPGLRYVLRYIANLVGGQGEIQQVPFIQTNPYPIFENSVIVAFVLGVLFALSIYPWLKNKLQELKNLSNNWYWIITITGGIFLINLLVLSIGVIIHSGPLPGVYEKF